MKLSVVIITFNEERNIERCLKSVQAIADEILVLDSFSTDQTKAICERYGVRFLTNPFEGHIQQKNKAWQLATGDYVLSLDADEALTKELEQSIAKLKNEEKPLTGYRMNRLTNYCGSWIKHSGWYPDTKLRLFQHGKGAWGGVNPHDRFELSGNEETALLEGDLLHYSYYTKEDHFKQIEYFSKIAASELFQKGKKVSSLHMYGKVVWQFFKNLVFKSGWRDGIAGWNIAKRSAFATYRKYSILKELHNNG